MARGMLGSDTGWAGSGRRSCDGVRGYIVAACGYGCRGCGGGGSFGGVRVGAEADDSADYDVMVEELGGMVERTGPAAAQIWPGAGFADRSVTFVFEDRAVELTGWGSQDVPRADIDVLDHGTPAGGWAWRHFFADYGGHRATVLDLEATADTDLTVPDVYPPFDPITDYLFALAVHESFHDTQGEWDVPSYVEKEPGAYRLDLGASLARGHLYQELWLALDSPESREEHVANGPRGISVCWLPPAGPKMTKRRRFTRGPHSTSTYRC